MKLTPVEILHHLGFDVPEEGIEISQFDEVLTRGALRLAGQSIDFANVPDQQLAALHKDLTCFATAAREALRDEVDPVTSGQPAIEGGEVSAEALERTRSFLKVMLRVTLRHTPPKAP